MSPKSTQSSSGKGSSAEAPAEVDEVRHAVQFIHWMGRAVATTVFVTLGGFLLFALISYNLRDPSLNTVTTTPPDPSLHVIRAYVADIGHQLFGYGSYLFAVVPFFWAVALYLPKASPASGFRWGRAALWFLVSTPLCLLGAAVIAATLAQTLPGDFPGGGVFGARMLDFVRHLVHLDFLRPVLVALGVPGLVLFGFAAQISLRGYLILANRLGALVLFLLKILWRGLRWTTPSLKRKDSAPTPEKAQQPGKKDKMRPPKTVKRAPEVVAGDRVPPSLSGQNNPPRQQPLDLETIAVVPGIQTEQARPASRKNTREQDQFVLPGLDLLNPPSEAPHAAGNQEQLQANARQLEEVLGDFGVRGTITRIRPGPVVTMYELEPAPGTKTSRVINLSDDIARTMRAFSVRIAAIPGHSALGIELPNKHRELVNMREILASTTYQTDRAMLPMILGKTIDGTPLIVDLANMPHLLIAGTTGSGKSVGLNVILLSILYRLNPDQCRIIMIDPKMLEFSVYDGIPHLLTPVVTDPRRAVVALKWTVREMEHRYHMMSKVGVRNINGFNARIVDAKARGESLNDTRQAGPDFEADQPMVEFPDQPLPLIVVVVDEMADLMIVAGKEIEASIQRLAQMARAAGIHLIMATQRPSVDVITGTIKANFPTRISYRVTSKIDSRTIIGEQGAEQLLGKGDLLLMQAAGNITRVHAPFVEDREVERICTHLRSQRQVEYLDAVTDEGTVNAGLGDVSAAMLNSDPSDDEASLYDQAVAIVANHQKASTSFIQRQLRIGYNRAADLIDEMERQGVISPPDHKNRREVLVQGFEE